jgi:type II secretory pathway pseudopilin PulG
MHYRTSQPTRASRTRPHPTLARREAGVGVLEIVVVLLIIGVLIGVGTMSMRGTQTRSNTAKARSVAIQLGEAIQQFQRDHGGRPPGQPGTVDWGNAWISPIDRGNGNRTYASQTALDALNGGGVSLERTNGTAGPRASTTTRIRYFENAAANQYALVVYVRRDGAMRPICWTSNSSAADARALIRNVVTKTC